MYFKIIEPSQNKFFSFIKFEYNILIKEKICQIISIILCYYIGI